MNICAAMLTKYLTNSYIFSSRGYLLRYFDFFIYCLSYFSTSQRYCILKSIFLSVYKNTWKRECEIVSIFHCFKLLGLFLCNSKIVLYIFHVQGEEQTQLEPETLSTQSCCIHNLELDFRHAVRSTHIDKSIEAKRKVSIFLYFCISFEHIIDPRVPIGSQVSFI